MISVEHRRGSTFEMQCRYKRDGEYVDLLAEAILVQSQVRDSTGGLIAELDVEMKDQSQLRGGYRLRAVDTDAWPIGSLRWDIKYTDSAGTVSHTETLSIRVRSVVTL